LNKAIGSLKAADEVQKKQQATARDMARQSAMLENMAAAVTYADRDGKITYVNPAAMQMLKKIEKHLPVRLDQLIGQSIDVFHNNPANQRRILADPKNLPYRAQLQVGGETFDLIVSAIFDQNKDYIGNLVSWECITEKVAKDRQNADYGCQLEAINKSQAVIEFQLDGTIISANDNFLKTLGYSLD